MLVLPQLVNFIFQDINLTLENDFVCHIATLIAPTLNYIQQVVKL